MTRLERDLIFLAAITLLILAAVGLLVVLGDRAATLPDF